MSLVNRRTLISAVVALLVGLAIYGIAQGSDLLPLGAQPAPQEESPEAAAPSVVQQEVEIPSGAVMFFNLSSCPTGWTELTAAKGRYIVGLLDGGTLAGTSGTAFTTDRENRAVGQHTHSVNDSGHGHTVNDPGHSHIATDSGHSHTNTVNDLGHSHTFQLHDESGGGYVDDSGSDYYDTETTSTEQTGITVDIHTGNANITVDSNITGVSVNNSTTGVTVGNAGSVAGTNAPYIQLLVCQKD